MVSQGDNAPEDSDDILCVFCVYVFCFCVVCDHSFVPNTLVAIPSANVSLASSPMIMCKAPTTTK